MPMTDNSRTTPLVRNHEVRNTASLSPIIFINSRRRVCREEEGEGGEGKGGKGEGEGRWEEEKVEWIEWEGRKG